MGQREEQISPAGEEQRPDGHVEDVTIAGLKGRAKILLAEALQSDDWSVRFKAIRLILGKGDKIQEAADPDERLKQAQDAEEALFGGN